MNYSAMGFSRKLVWYRIEGSLCDRSADAYFAAEKRLSNEFDDTIGWAPATRLPAGAGAAAVSVSVTDGFSGGRAVASFVSAFGAAVFGIDASFRLASTVFGLVGTGAGAAAVAVVSAVAPPRPTLRARLLKKPSDSELDWAAGAADATRVAGADAAGVIEATSGSSGAET